MDNTAKENRNSPAPDLSEEDSSASSSKLISHAGDVNASSKPDSVHANVEDGKRHERDWSQYDLMEGPPVFEEGVEDDDDDGSSAIEHLEVFKEGLQLQVTVRPRPIDAAITAKKDKEAKKNAEKEAKKKKFLEKQQQATTNLQKPVEGKQTKDKPKPTAAKEKGPSGDELLQTLLEAAPGSKKPTNGSLPDAYDPKYVEAVWYPWWVSQGFFKPEYGLGDESLEQAIERRGKFVMVIPPPNVTGTLHLGHALTNAFEDVLTRWNRMRGKVTLWVPGCDHAGIATQMVVEKTLARNEGKSRHDLGRAEFTKRVWQWKEQKGERIYEQLKRMGISADWDRAAFTMDEKLCKAVTKAFVALYDWGFIYRSDRLVNWSCTLKSCISDIEVDKVELTGKTFLPVPGYKDKVEFGVLTSFAYKIDEKTEIIVATTRPETMLGDVAIAVHPEDERYRNLIGKKARHPFVDRDLPIIADDFVDREFGTGCVKITPAHDANDYDVGKRHGLEFVTIIDEDGNMTDNCGKFSKMKRFDARKAVVAALTELKMYREAKDNPMVVPICSRSKDVVEPLLKMQWYVNCSQMAKDALEVVKEQKLRVIPDIHLKTWNFWMEGIRDWCISRQLWWGHQIPAYKISGQGLEAGEEIWVAAESESAAMEKARAKYPSTVDLVVTRDEDVLDTWFSSGLFPFSVFGWPEVDNSDFKLFYPTDLLETGYDILFFWVARMVFMGMTLTKQLPFKDVFLHSIVRDAHGRKMSKSLGNIVDPVDVIQGISLADLHKSLEGGNLDPKEVQKAQQGQKQDYPNGIPECGTDALRFALCACMTLGRDMNLDVLRVQGYRFFCNKIWNAVKFSMNYWAIPGYTPSSNSPNESVKSVTELDRMDRWILSSLSTLVRVSNDALERYDFPTVTSAIHTFWLYDLCDVYLESLKPKFTEARGSSVTVTPLQQQHLDVLLFCVETGLCLLAPFMPFLTEELWQRLPVFGNHKSNRPSSICVAKYPQMQQFLPFEDEIVKEEVILMNKLIHTIRSSRAAYNLPNRIKTEGLVLNTEPSITAIIQEDGETISALSFSSLRLIKSKDEIPTGSAASVVSDRCTVYLLLKGVIDPTKEEERLQKKLGITKQQLNKLTEAVGKTDYEARVPLEVQEANATKLKALDGEIKELVDAINSVKLMIAEQ